MNTGLTVFFALYFYITRNHVTREQSWNWNIRKSSAKVTTACSPHVLRL